ncbi:potassium channel, subfamily K, member 16-like [Ptychodera flava]|uniref:potassium channel, subfamily K, member 16-like n=1 Tax=Ptychodera flava TaxID=63121 RepID=UPI00396A415D
MTNKGKKSGKSCGFSTTCKVNLLLTLSLATYLFCGAYMFLVLEAEYREGMTGNKTESQIQLLSRLHNLKDADHDNWTREVDAAIGEYEVAVIADYEATSSWRPWDFPTCLYMSVMAITTVGFGDIAPVTQGGRLLMFIYSLFGVPLNLLFLSNFGILLASFTSRKFKKVMKRARRSIRQNSTDRIDPQETPNELKDEAVNGTINYSNSISPKARDTAETELSPVPPCEELPNISDVENQVANDDVVENPDNSPMIDSDPIAKGKALGTLSVIYVLYTALGAVFMYYTEYDWTFIDAIYCTFITLSTIGYGDLIPGAGVLKEYRVLGPAVYFVFTYVGLIIFSACIALSVEKIRHVAGKIRRKLEKSDCLLHCHREVKCQEDDQNHHGQ